MVPAWTLDPQQQSTDELKDAIEALTLKYAARITLFCKGVNEQVHRDLQKAMPLVRVTWLGFTEHERQVMKAANLDQTPGATDRLIFEAMP